MKTIEIEDSVYLALKNLIQDFEEKPNDVIKRLLDGPTAAESTKLQPPKNPAPTTAITAREPLVQLVTSPRYMTGDAKERYFAVLSYLYQKNADQFTQFEGFKRGSRINISKNIRRIEESGTSTQPQKLNGTPYYVMTNLDNRRKREILQDILQILHYPREVITAVVNSIPDSGISRPKRSLYNEYVDLK